jgi:hypothetical protein
MMRIWQVNFLKARTLKLVSTRLYNVIRMKRSNFLFSNRRVLSLSKSLSILLITQSNIQHHSNSCLAELRKQTPIKQKIVVIEME